MTKIIFIFFIFSAVLFANTDQSWNLGQASTIEKGRLETGVFLPLRYGITETLEVSTFPLFDFIMPNVTIKKNFVNKKDKLYFSTEHSFLYPTLALKLVSKRGIFGLLPETSKIPQIISTEHAFILTYKFSDYFVVTTRAGLFVPIIFNSVKDEDFPELDMMLLYQRTISYKGLLVYNLSLDIDGKIFSNFFYGVDVDFYKSIPAEGKELPLNIESKILLTWKSSKDFAIFLGAKFIWGDYPGGKADLTILPLFDVAFTF